MSRSSKQRCTATTRSGRPCRGWAIQGTDPPRCAAHRSRRPPGDGGCTGSAERPPGSPKGEAHGVEARTGGSDVQRHGYDTPAGGCDTRPDDRHDARSGADDTRRSGCDTHPPTGVDIDTRIADLNRRIEQLSRYIDEVQIGPPPDGIDVDQYARLLSLHGQLTSRIGRLLRDKQTIAPEDDSWLQACFNDALDQASQILGVAL